MKLGLRARQLPDTLLDSTVLGFGLWTVCCHAVLVSGGTGHALLATAGVAFVLVGLAPWVLRRRFERLPEQAPALPHPSVGAGAVPPSLLGLLGAALVLWSWQQWHDGWRFWLASLLFVLASSVAVLWRSRSAELDASRDPPGGWATLALVALGLVGLSATALMVHPNTDDVLYVALGVSLADHPEHVLFSQDTLHGHGLMELFVPYKVHSFELLAGALAWLTGSEVLGILHLGFAPYAGLLTAFAWARLFRILEPARWLGLTAIVVSWYVFDATTERSIPGHAFLRLFQGKSILLTVAVPLISAYAISFVLRPSVRGWLLFACSTISGIGLSSTGLWLAFLVALTALLVPITPRRAFFQSAALGATSLLYPVAIALWVKSKLPSVAPASAAAPPAPAWLDGDAVASVLETYVNHLKTFGPIRIGHAYVLCLVVAWPLARTALARRYLLAFSLGGLAILVNPHLSSLVGNYITGAATQSRALWYLPFAAALATCFGAALPVSRSRWRLTAASLITVVALHQFYAHFPRHSAFAYAELPVRLKVDPVAHRIARYLVKHVDERRSVLAPVSVSLVVPMLRHHPYTVLTKPKFLGEERFERYRVRGVVEGRVWPMTGWRARRFAHGLEAYDVAGVVLSDVATRVQGLRPLLGSAGFRKARSLSGHEVWLRAQVATK